MGAQESRELVGFCAIAVSRGAHVADEAGLLAVLCLTRAAMRTYRKEKKRIFKRRRAYKASTRHFASYIERAARRMSSQVAVALMLAMSSRISLNAIRMCLRVMCYLFDDDFERETREQARQNVILKAPSLRQQFRLSELLATRVAGSSAGFFVETSTKKSVPSLESLLFHFRFFSCSVFLLLSIRAT
jgi:hypothetical protein